MLNAELMSMNSNLTYVHFLSRCVRAGWRAVAMASSVERLDLYAKGGGEDRLDFIQITPPPSETPCKPPTS